MSSKQPTPQHIKMNLISDVMAATGSNRKEATTAVAAVYDSIFTALASGKAVRLDNIGTLTPRHVSERPRRNPATGETFTAPAHDVVVFKQSKSGRALLNASA